MRACVVVVLMAVGCGSNGPAGDTGPVLEPNPLPRAFLQAQSIDLGSSVGTSLGADFLTGASTAGPCTVQTMGACTVRSCPSGRAGMPDQAALVDAGTVTFTGVGQPIVLGPRPELPAEYVGGNMQMSWNGGDSIGFQITGAVAPAFTLAVPAPDRTDILTPAFPPSAGMMKMNRADGLRIGWKPVKQGTMRLSIGILPVSVVCTAPADAGSLTVTPEQLAFLSETDAYVSADLVSETQKTIDGWTIKLTASTQGSDAQSGQLWGGTLVLQ